MSGTAASCDPTHDPHLREASWLDLTRGRENVASVGPPIWPWTVPSTRAGVAIDAYLGSFDEERDTQDGLLVMEYPDRLVVAVADGVTPDRHDADDRGHRRCALCRARRPRPRAGGASEC